MSASGMAVGRWHRLDETRLAIGLIALLTALRFALAPIVPLAFDEAYYWRWSTNLAFGYLDHPPLVAWMIRAGTTIAGDTYFGIRLVFLLASILASWAVWRAAEILFEDRRIAALATLFFNLTLIVAVGTILATPDAPLVVVAAVLLYCLARITKGGGPEWWLAAGAVAGVGFLAKYTAMFWLPSILLWLVLDRRMRPALRTPWPWLAALASLVVFLPNLVWNVQHDMMTFAKQFGRVDDGSFGVRYLFEHIGTEIGMATPIIFILGWLALAMFFRGRGGPATARILLGVMVWPISLYFIYHSLHARVEGNWSGPIFPAFAIAAAVAAVAIDWRGSAQKAVAVLRILAVPVGLVVVAAIYVQAAFGILPLGNWDPTASRLGRGIPELAAQIEGIRRDQNATMILTRDYGLTAWLTFYSPVQPAPVAQLGEPERYIQEPPLSAETLAGPMILVLPEGRSPGAEVDALGRATLLGTVERRRDDLLIATFDVYVVRRSALARAP